MYRWLKTLLTQRRDIPIRLNRTAVIVYQRKPYHRWAADCLQPGFESAWLQIHGTVYLVSFDFLRDDLNQWVDRQWPRIFMDQLSHWTEDESLWPTNRTRGLFNQWFDVRVAELVEDLWPDTLECD